VSNFKTIFLSLPGRYANALLMADDIDHRPNLQLMHETMIFAPELRNILFGGSCDSHHVFTLISGLAQILELHQTFANFLKVIYQNKRYHYFEDIKKHYGTMYRAKHNIRAIDIYTAQTLTAKQKAGIEAFYQDMYKSFAQLDFNYHDDKNVLAGAVVESEGDLFDFSLKTQIKQLTQQIKEINYAA
jgi:ATP synthase F1 delta subunit